MGKKFNDTDITSTPIDQSNTVGIGNQELQPMTRLTPNIGDISISGLGDFHKDKFIDPIDAKYNPEDIDYQRADLQSGAELWGKGLGQLGVEFTVGTVENFGYLLDLEDLGNSENMANREYDNAMSKWLRDGKEDFEENNLKIYKSRAAESGSFSDKFGDATWWAGHGKMAGNSLGMMGAAMATGGMAAAFGVGALGTGLIAGLASAKVEATMEAGGKFREDYDMHMNDPKLKEEAFAKYDKEATQILSEYDKLAATLYNPLEENYQELEAQKQYRMQELDGMMNQIKSEVDKSVDLQARTMAGQAASKVYLANAIKAPLEVAQYMVGLKAFSGIKNGIKTIGASKAGVVANMAFQPASEAVEEVYQGFASEEATASVKGDVDFFGEGATDRIAEYATSEEGKEAAFLGAAMGIMFDVGSTQGAKLIKKIKKNTDELTKDPTITASEYSNKSKKNNVDILLGNYAIDAEKLAKKEPSDNLKKSLDLYNSSVEESMSKAETEEQKAHIRKQSEEIKEYYDLIKKEDETLAGNTNFKDPQLRAKYVSTKLLDKVYEEESKSLKSILDGNLTMDASGMPTLEGALYQANEQIKLLKQAGNDVIEDHELTKDEKESLISHIETEIVKNKGIVDGLIKTVSQTKPGFKITDLTPRNAEEIKKFTKELLKTELYKDSVLKGRLNSFVNITSPKATEASKSINKKDNAEVIKNYEYRISESTNKGDLKDLEESHAILQRQYPKAFAHLEERLNREIEKLKGAIETPIIEAKQADVIKDFKTVINETNSLEDLTELKSKVSVINGTKESISKLTKLIDAKIKAIPAAEVPVETGLVKIKVKQGGKAIIGKEFEAKLVKGNYQIKSLGKPTYILKPNQVEVLSSKTTPVDETSSTHLFNDDGNSTEPKGGNAFMDAVKKGGDVVTRDIFDETPSNDDLNKVGNVDTVTESIQTVLTNAENAVLEAVESKKSANNEDVGHDILTDKILDDIEKNTEAVDGTDRIKMIEYTPNIVLTTLAKERGEGNKGDSFTSDGNIILMPDYDASMAGKNKHKVGSTVVMFVNPNNFKYVKGKITADNIPISVMDVQDHADGKTPHISIRNLSNKDWDKMNSDARSKTKELRQKLYDDYAATKGKPNTFYTTVTKKDGGHTNKSNRVKSLKEALYLKDKGYIDIKLGVSQTGVVALTDGTQAINSGMSSGIPFLMVENAIGENVAFKLEYGEIKKLGNYNKIVDTVFALIEGHILGKKELKDSDVHEEVSKYIYLRKFVDDSLKEKTHPANEALNEIREGEKIAGVAPKDLTKLEHNNVFGLDSVDGISFNLYLPNTKGYKYYEVKAVNGQLVATEVNQVNGKSVRKTINAKQLKEAFVKRLDNMYPNVLKEAGENPVEFKVYELDEQGKLVSKTQHYFDFLSEVGNVGTRIIPVLDKDGNAYFTTQPNVQVDHNIKTKTEFDALQKKVPQVDDVVIKEAEVKKVKKTKKVVKSEPTINIKSEQQKKKNPSVIDRLRNSTASPILLDDDGGYTIQFLYYQDKVEVNQRMVGGFEDFEEMEIEVLNVGNYYTIGDYGQSKIVTEAEAIEIYNKSLGNQETPIAEDKPATGRRIKNGDIDKGDFDSEESNLAIENVVDYNNASLSSFSNMESIEAENNIMNSMLGILLEELDFQRELNEKPSLTDGIDQVKANLELERSFFEKHSTKDINKEQAKADGVSIDFNKNKQILDAYNLVLDNFEESFNEDGSTRFIGYGKKLELIYRTLSFKSIEDDSVEDEGINEKNRFIDGLNYQTDPEKSMSAQIKRLLSLIPKINPNGKNQLNKLGLPTYEDFGKVFNYLMENLSNVAIDDIITELEDVAASNYIAQGALDKLNEIRVKNPEILNKFVSVMKKQKAEFISLIMDEKTGNEGQTYINGKVINSNRTGAKDIIFEKWQSKFRELGLKSKLLKEKKGTIVVDSKEGAKLLNEFNVIINNLYKSEDSAKSKEQLIALFNKVGIKFSKEAFDKLEKDFKNRDNKKYFKQLFGEDAVVPTFNKDGDLTSSEQLSIFMRKSYYYIFENLKEGKNPYKDQTGRISSLAIYEQKFDLDASSQSFRNQAGDMIYGFVNPHHLSNMIDRLKTDSNALNVIKEDVFKKHSTWLENLDQLGLVYFDASTNNKSGSLAKNYEDQNDFEKEVTKINLYLNANNANYSYMFTPSPSDKTTFALIKVKRMDTKKDKLSDGVLTLSNETDQALYDLLIMSEVDRINKTVKDFNKADRKNKLAYRRRNILKNKDNAKPLVNSFNELKDGYNYHNGKVGAGAFFFFLPKLNKLLIREKDGSIDMTNETNVNIAKTELNTYLKNGIDQKLDFWTKSGANNYFDGKGRGRRGDLASLAVEYVINSAVSYANQFMLITGDPALFAKIPKDFNGKFEDYAKVIEGTLPNMFKRVAKDIAPGYEGNFTKKTYRIAFINEPVKASDLAKENPKSPYAKIKLADAQEWTTLEEHIDVMFSYGRLNEIQRDAILANRENLTWGQIGLVLQPMKPVQVFTGLNEVTNMGDEYYIKTSSFPLIPQLTRGFPQLEKMRNFMEKNKIDRLVPKTAVKVGFRNATTLFEDGNFIDKNDFSASRILTLGRDGFRIQQDIPHDVTKDSILEGSQGRKLVHGDIEEDWLFDNDTISGKELKQLSDDIHSELYKRRFDDLIKELGVENLRIRDIRKLRDMMVTEALDRGYGHNDILMLNTRKLANDKTTFDIPLFFNPMVHKIESLLNSLIKNRVLKNKLPGASKVLGSSLGFQVQTEDFLEMISGTIGAVILTKDYKGSLDYREDENGLYAEIFIPSYFTYKDEFGNKQNLDIKQYIGKDGLLDISKIDPELLNLIGYRIPTQGFNSMVRLKVVGILPEAAGDLIIVPPAMTVQMGADFDVDKLYIYKSNNSISKSGKLKKLDSAGNINKLSDDQLQNKLIDIYHSILKHKEVIKMAKEPLENSIVEDLLNNELKSTQANELSVINDDLHTKMIDTQVAGQIGIGITSIASTFHALSQYSGLYIKANFKKGEEPKFHSVRFNDTNEDDVEVGEKSSTPTGNTANSDVTYGAHAQSGAWRLDKIYGFTKRRISEVLKNLQNEAVDNANNGRLFGMHLNRHTFGVAMLIGRVGYDERTIGLFLNQPIIKEYITRLRDLNNFTDIKFVADKKSELQRELFKSIGITDNMDKIKVGNISDKDMLSELNSLSLNTPLQRTALKNFMIYEEIALSLQKAQAVLNVDTKFLGSNFSGVINRANKFDSNLMNSTFIGNTENLYNGTTAGSAYDFGVTKTIELFGMNNLLPYDSDVMSDIFNEISSITDRDLSDEEIEDVTIGIRSSIWGKVMTDLFPQIGNLNDYRKSLLFGENNLAKRVILAKDKYHNNAFIQGLNPKEAYDTNDPATIEHYSSKDAKAEYDFRKQSGWLALLKAPKNSEEYQLGFDLFVYATTFGTKRTARDFGRFLPYDFISKSGLAEALRSVSFVDGVFVEKLKENFVRQYFQHMPNKLSELYIKKFVSGKIEDTMQLDPGVDINLEPRFTKHYDKTKKVVKVYELVGDIYYLRDSLGFGFLTELDLDRTIAETIMPTNVKGVKFVQKSTVQPSQLTENYDGEDILRDHNFDDGIIAVLDSIHESNTWFSGLANYFNDKLNRVTNYSLERFDLNNPIHYKEGELAETRGKLISKRGKIMAINVKYVDSTNSFQHTTMHETSHLLTIKILETPKDQLTAKQIKAVDNLEKLFNKVKAIPGLDLEAKSYRNAFKNTKEFVAEVFTNQELHKLLNKHKIEGGTFWDKFMQIISELFPGVVKGSYLEASLHAALELVEVSEGLGAPNTDVNKVFSEVDNKEGEKIKIKCIGKK